MDLRICELAADNYAGAFRADRLIVRMPLRDCKNLPGFVDCPLIVLRDDEGASENEAPNRERMSVLPCAGRGSSV